MLNLNSQSDYGILFVTSLIDKTDYIPLSELIYATKLPRRFLARIAAELAKNGLVESKEGKSGGYKLTRKINNVSLYDYLKIFEGDLNLAKCSDPKYRCQWDKMCHHRNFLSNTLSNIVINQLKKRKFREILYAHS